MMRVVPTGAQVLNVVELDGYRYATLDDTPSTNRLSGAQTRSIGLPAGWAIADRAVTPTVPAAQSFAWGTECLVLADGSMVETQIGSSCASFLVDDGTGLHVRPKNKRVFISQKSTLAVRGVIELSLGDAVLTWRGRSVGAVAVIDSVVPTFGTNAGDTIVTISGLGLGDGSDITSVVCGGIVAKIVSQTADQVIVATGASQTTGAGDVVVTSTTRGASTKPSGYTYVLRTLAAGDWGETGPGTVVPRVPKVARH